jgi:uncharacterized membrane protein
MSFDEWILSLHVLSAFAWVAGIVLFSVLVVASRGVDTPADTIRIQPVARVGGLAVMIGATGTVAFGVWLAFSYGGYDIWDGWIVAALVLWALAGALGARTGAEYTKALDKAKALQSAGRTGPDPELLALNRTPRGAALHAATSLLTLLILVDMIWKPGA